MKSLVELKKYDRCSMIGSRLFVHSQRLSPSLALYLFATWLCKTALRGFRMVIPQQFTVHTLQISFFLSSTLTLCPSCQSATFVSVCVFVPTCVLNWHYVIAKWLAVVQSSQLIWASQRPIDYFKIRIRFLKMKQLKPYNTDNRAPLYLSDNRTLKNTEKKTKMFITNVQMELNR